jgi:hypothetical protein
MIKGLLLVSVRDEYGLRERHRCRKCMGVRSTSSWAARTGYRLVTSCCADFKNSEKLAARRQASEEASRTATMKASMV